MKSRRVWLVVSALAILVSTSPHSVCAAKTGPSFDCATAKTSVERAICGEPMLADEDRRMAIFCRALLDALPSERQSALKRTQRAWLQKRDQCSSAKSMRNCIWHLYGKRGVELEAISAESTVIQDASADGTEKRRNSLYGFTYRGPTNAGSTVQIYGKPQATLALYDHFNGHFVFVPRTASWESNGSPICLEAEYFGDSSIPYYCGKLHDVVNGVGGVDCAVLTNQSYGIEITIINRNQSDILASLQLPNGVKAVLADCNANWKQIKPLDPSRP